MQVPRCIFLIEGRIYNLQGVSYWEQTLAVPPLHLLFRLKEQVAIRHNLQEVLPGLY